MPRFSLVIEYLIGYAVATDPADRDRPEWPPHPARVFMALAAAHFETDGSPEEKQAERDALDWLATLPPPDVMIPEHSPRDVLDVYVPVNDMELPAEKEIEKIDWNALRADEKKFKSAADRVKGLMTILPSSRTNKQPRTFPRVHVGSEPLRQTWHVPDGPPAGYLEALESICRKVTRIGHSSSLVWARLERDVAAEPTHVADESGLDTRLRIVQAGAMGRLEEAFNKSAIDEFAALEKEISSSKDKAKKRQLQTSRQERFPRGQPTSKRPVFSISSGYTPVKPPHEALAHSLFDPNFIVLREDDEAPSTFGLESTARLTQALRGLLMSQSKVQPAPSWVGGHEFDGGKLESGDHLSLIPLAFIGRPWIDVERHADGHLMGVGIVLPRSVSPRERASALSSILFDASTNTPSTLHLRMGYEGDWKVVRETSLSPRHTLQARTYNGPSRSWASVTPVLLDRMPKVDRVKDPVGWREEVAGIVAQSCRNIGLPQPVAVRVERTPFFHGSLRGMPGQGGFPQLRKDKHQVHIVIEFNRDVLGPVLLGAGRFRGYGLMRPWRSEQTS